MRWPFIAAGLLFVAGCAVGGQEEISLRNDIDTLQRSVEQCEWKLDKIRDHYDSLPVATDQIGTFYNPQTGGTVTHYPPSFGMPVPEDD